MSEEPDNLIAELRNIIESHVNEQFVRHSRFDENVDYKRIVELQMLQEREKLERLLDKCDDQTIHAEVIQALMCWLPELEHKLKNRY